VALGLADEAALLVCDRGYLRHQKEWRERVAAEAPCPVERVEGEVVVPVETVTDKREYAARTIRPRIHEHLDRFLVELDTTSVDDRSGPELARETGGDPGALDPSDVDGILDTLELDRSVPAVSHLWTGGTRAARERLRRFRDDRLARYTENRNQPQTDDVSEISPYLHFGQLSPVYACLWITESGAGSQEDRDTFLEELVVRRELAMNYVHFEPEYDSFDALPDWALTTMSEHADDEREHLYTREELEEARTHDPYWNAAMREMRYTGFMHNYMRMYWGKKILEWTPSHEEAYETTLFLNNRYFLDGRDPASFSNVAWIFGLHDRAWTEREVFGKLRYMNANGLKRKADPEAYVEKVDRRVEEAKAAGVRLPGD
jgi:deoxyribodipyrimidine photo-lyase